MTADDGFKGLQRADEHRRRLRKIIGAVTAVADGLDATVAIANLSKTGARVDSDAFRVMVVGEFKRGKSTLINAMLGRDVLPAYARPATAVLTEVRWSEQPTAVLHPADGGPGVDVSIEDLSKHITIPKGIEQGSAQTSPWKLAEVGWPLDLLRDGVVLIDSPGLNEHPARQEVTLQNLSRADAIVFVQDAQHPVAMEEVRFMDLYLDGYDVFFVFNKINFIPPGEVIEVKDETITRVRRHRDPHSRDRYFFVNALAALQARISDDDAGWRNSAVAGFADELNSFLATERHRAKLTGPARETGKEIRELRRTIVEKRALLALDEASLTRRYQEAQAPLRRLDQSAAQIRQRLGTLQRHTAQLVRSEVNNRLLKMSSEMSEIIEELTPASKLSLRPWKTKESAEAYARELSESASARAMSRFGSWQKTELKGTLEPELKAMATEADKLVGEFMRALAKVRENLTGLEFSPGDAISGLDEQGFAQADLGGMHFGGGIAVGHIMVQIAATYGVLTVWAFTPFGLVPLIIGVLIANSGIHMYAKEKMETKVRKELGAALSQMVRADAGDNAAKTAGEVSAALGSAVNDLMSRIDNELTQLRAQVEDSLLTLSQGSEAVSESRERLTEWETVLEKSGDEVEDLISDVALT